MSSLTRALSSTLKFNRLIGPPNRIRQPCLVHSVQRSLDRCYSIEPELKDKLDRLVKQQKIVLFMKGGKNNPKCGFSNVITQVCMDLKFEKHFLIS